MHAPRPTCHLEPRLLEIFEARQARSWKELLSQNSWTVARKRAVVTVLSMGGGPEENHRSAIGPALNSNVLCDA